METRDQKLRLRLEKAFEPQELMVKDQSQLHVGHEGAREGKGHFEVIIVSEKFQDVTRVKRHRMVYDVLGDLIESDIHALRIRAYTPTERGRSASRTVIQPRED